MFTYFVYTSSSTAKTTLLILINELSEDIIYHTGLWCSKYLFNQSYTHSSVIVQSECFEKFSSNIVYGHFIKELTTRIVL